MLPQPWSKPLLPFSATRRPNSEMVTTVTRCRSVAEVVEEGRERLGEAVDVVGHRAAGDVAVVGVQVPVAGVDGDDVGADVGLDQLGGGLEGRHERVAFHTVGYFVALAGAVARVCPGPLEMPTAVAAPPASGVRAPDHMVSSEE